MSHLVSLWRFDLRDEFMGLTCREFAMADALVRLAAKNERLMKIRGMRVFHRLLESRLA